MYAITEKYLTTLVKLAALDKHYAWKRAQELARDPMFAELPALLTEAMRNEARTDA